jgi:hypothetical protein
MNGNLEIEFYSEVFIFDETLIKEIFSTFISSDDKYEVVSDWRWTSVDIDCNKDIIGDYVDKNKIVTGKLFFSGNCGGYMNYLCKSLYVFSLFCHIDSFSKDELDTIIEKTEQAYRKYEHQYKLRFAVIGNEFLFEYMGDIDESYKASHGLIKLIR